MSRASSLPYQLRPNKAVDRELFLSLLSRLSGVLELEDYTYVGLGGPFLEDFRLIHSRIGISKMVSVEAEKEVHKRQLFNRPVPSVNCIHSTLEDYVETTYFDKPVVLWFDYTDPKPVIDQIARFADAASSLPINSVLRITLSADPQSLKIPQKDEVQTPPNGVKDPDDERPTLFEWRLERFRERMGRLFPDDVGAEDMTRTRFGRALLKSLKLKVSDELLGNSKRSVTWLLATHYADGLPMVTATLLVVPSPHGLGEVAANWPFLSHPDTPLVLDMPVISSRERLTLEAHGGLSEEMQYELPMSKLDEDPVESFKRFYRVFPHFSKIEL